ncbi:phosphate-starvation-inducible PsiE family protein [Hyalangium gracile]|uniref:phosphate-starvation-inducible PsiE family protein n=1 Tax=Hyalangium gracile TaxID=394092 RepID=UPI001CCD8B4B|nr:phosphate-starvation-inducible PsiE family protein [Hyalangium gracile]
MSTESDPSPEGRLSLIIKKFERFVVVSIIVMMMVVVALSTLELGWIITKDIITPPILLLDEDELLEIFGFVLLILIGVELLETIKAYLRDSVIHVEIVLEVALIAIARKVIVVDLSKYDGISVLALAALIIALAAASFLRVSRGQSHRR